MDIVKSLKCFPIIGALILIPAACLADSASCAGDAPTNPANYSQEASRLLQAIGADAHQVTTEVAELKPFANNGSVDWDFQAEKLAGIQSQVNDMDDKICRLKTIEHVVPGRQQKTIRFVASEVANLAANAQDATNHVRARQGEIWSSSYRMYTRNLYDEAKTVGSTIEHAEHTARVRADTSAVEEAPGLVGK